MVDACETPLTMITDNLALIAEVGIVIYSFTTALTTAAGVAEHFHRNITFHVLFAVLTFG